MNDQQDKFLTLLNLCKETFCSLWLQYSEELLLFLCLHKQSLTLQGPVLCLTLLGFKCPHYCRRDHRKTPWGLLKWIGSLPDVRLPLSWMSCSYQMENISTLFSSIKFYCRLFLSFFLFFHLSLCARSDNY